MARVARRWMWGTRILASSLVLALGCAACEVGPVLAGTLPRGQRTAEAAVRAEPAGQDTLPPFLGTSRPGGGLPPAAALPDTTEVEFPQEEERRPQHLYRDIGIFFLVSAFVGYFIVKVFLEGDTEEPAPPKKGKEIPQP